MDRVWIVVRDLEGRLAALPCFLPLSAGLVDQRLRAPGEVATGGIRIDRESWPSVLPDPTALYRWCHAHWRHAAGRPVVLFLDAVPDAPFHRVVGVLNEARRFGFEVRFRGGPDATVSSVAGDAHWRAAPLHDAESAPPRRSGIALDGDPTTAPRFGGTHHGQPNWPELPLTAHAAELAALADREVATRLGSTGTTGAAVLAFLGSGHTHRRGRFADTVKSHLQHLGRQLTEDGRFSDAPRENLPATLAVVEAYARSGSPLFKAFSLRAVERILADPSTSAADPERAAWSAAILLSARKGKLEVDGDDVAKLLAAAARWRDDPPLAATATILLRVLAGAEPPQEVVRTLLSDPPARPDRILLATLALARADEASWTAWPAKARRALAALRREDGTWGDVRETGFALTALSVIEGHPGAMIRR